MYLSFNWLADHVDLSGLTPAEVGEAMTMRTALVEGIHDQAAALEGVMVGEVSSCEKHPNADTLSVCKVAWGGDEPARVVCGAPNVAVGQKIFYAPVGTRLPNGVKLRKAKIRGEPSEGMICAEDELGLGPEHDGILVLDPGLAPGTPLADVPGYADVIFEVDNKSVTHRPDLWGHRGFARELAAVFGRELLPLALADDLVAGDHGPSITLEDPAGCPLYAGLCLEDQPHAAPDWMRFRLAACGMRPIDHLVDLSNYVMLELGQPTHPFDRDLLGGDAIVVRRAEAGETLVTLDDETRKLQREDLVIADGEQGVALAGIMGSAAAEVSGATRRVFLESASFDGPGVRRSSSRLGLRTEALARFEKCLDPALVEEAVRRYAHLLRRISPEARVETTFRVAGAAAAPETRVALDGDMVRARLGTDVADETIAATLASIGFGVTSTGSSGFEVAVPSWRATRDVSIPEDLVEEVGRLVGYDVIPTPDPTGPLRLSGKDSLAVTEDALRDRLAGSDAYMEVVGYSMVPDGVLGRLGFPADIALARLRNPLQKGASALRPAVVPGVIARLEVWLRADADVRVFELGRGYHLDAQGDVSESRELVVLRATAATVDSRELVRELRGTADDALAVLARGACRYVTGSPSPTEPWLHPRRTASVLLGDQVVGRIGAIAPQTLAALDVTGQAALLVLDLAALEACPVVPPAYRPVSRFPPARMDLAFIAPYELTTAEIEAAMRAGGPKTLVEVQPFDVYRGKPLEETERSVAFHLVFQAGDRTLKDSEVNKARDKIVRTVEQLGARLR